jgi:hypothetical protein
MVMVAMSMNQLLGCTTPLTLALMARGPEGENHLLVMVTDTPRDTKVLSTSAPNAAAPFTFALNDLEGRSALLDFFIGRGVTGTSESFGAQLLTIREVP